MVPLLAQHMMQIQPQEHLRWDVLLSMAVGLAVLLLLVGPVVMVFRHGQIRREWEHAERMRMIEMGMPVPPRDAPWAKAVVCFGIGAVVPVCAFLFTYLAYESQVSKNPLNAIGEIWLAPALVSGAGVLGASLLAGHLFSGRSRSGASGHDERMAAEFRARNAKPAPYADPDAVDVVGRRG